MARQYVAPVTEVALTARRPMRFTWQGRGYVVTAVLGHWVSGTAWWRAPEQADDDTHTWRVEAFPRSGSASSGSARVAMTRSGVYDLSCSGASWSLQRIAD